MLTLRLPTITSSIPSMSSRASLSLKEYLYLARESKGLDTEEIYKIGDLCLRKGLTDIFGIVTQRGHRSIEDFEIIMYGKKSSQS